MAFAIVYKADSCGKLLSEVIKNATGEEVILDGHTWLSLKYAQICNQAIYEALCEAVPQNKEMYEKMKN